MSLVSLIVVLVVVGIAMYLINAFVPMDANIKHLMNIAVIIFLILWILVGFGLFSPVSSIHLPR